MIKNHTAVRESEPRHCQHTIAFLLTRQHRDHVRPLEETANSGYVWRGYSLAKRQPNMRSGGHLIRRGARRFSERPKSLSPFSMTKHHCSLWDSSGLCTWGTAAIGEIGYRLEAMHAKSALRKTRTRISAGAGTAFIAKRLARLAGQTGIPLRLRG